MRSMTGFGRAEYMDSSLDMVVEMKSVNHRYLDLGLHMPNLFNPIEAEVRNLLKSECKRGRVDLFVSCKRKSEENNQVIFHLKMAEGYWNGLKEMADTFQTPFEPDIHQIGRFPEVFTLEDNSRILDDGLKNIFLDTLKKAMDGFVANREKEGEHLKEDLLAKVDLLTKITEEIAARSPEVFEEYKERLISKIQEVLTSDTVEEATLAQELVVYADKICIDEELVRLKGHIKNLKDTLNEEGSIGRQLDFISQELNREANTILSKANDRILAGLGIQLKTEIEKIREQIQNIE